MPKKTAEQPEAKNKYASQKQIAALLKITEYDIKKFARLGLPKAGNNKFEVVPVVQWYIDYLQYWRDRRSIADIANILGISERWLNRLVVEKGIPKEKHGVYQIAPTINGYVQFLKEQIKQAQEGEASLADERKRLLKMQADLRHIELLEKQKKLIPIEIYQEILLDFVSHTGKKLDSIPGVCLNKLFAAKTKEEILKVLKETIKKIKNELSSSQSNLKI